jgi:beta-N-acetylhexosaminidase
MRLRLKQLKIYGIFVVLPIVVLSVFVTILSTNFDTENQFVNNTVDEEQNDPTILEQEQKPVDEKMTHPQTEPVPPISEQGQKHLDDETEITSSLQEVSLDVKIGQMLMVGFRGLSVTDLSPIVQDIKKFHLGGVILFDYDIVLRKPRRNIQSPQQVKSLVEGLQVVSSIPLFIAIDQEGGKIARLNKKFGFPPSVSAQYLGEQNNLVLTYNKASEMAKTLVQLGINFNFAPVVDLNINPDNPVIGKLGRSFSADSVIVTQHALQFIRAHHDQGVISVLKHFPGHGSSTEDSHLGWVDVSESWNLVELEPYFNIIIADQVDAIMTAHVFNRFLDPEYPATLSKRIVTDMLRHELLYDGVVVSDDMQMKAIASNYEFKEAILATLEAGVDVIVIGNNLKYEADIAKRAVDVISELIMEGKISEERIDESFQRIQHLKSRWLAKRYKLTVDVEPSDECVIKILNIGSQYFPGIRLQPGSYEILVTKPGYVENRQWVDFKDTDVTLRVVLEKQEKQAESTLSYEGTCRALTISADPFDSVIKIMNIEQKYEPGMCLAPGRYDVLVTKPGYIENRQWLEIEDTEVTRRVVLEKKVESTPLSDGTCSTFTVKAKPFGSVIKIMNIEPKYEPGLCLAPGRYDVLVTKPGYIENRQWIEIRDTEVTKRVTLEKEAVRLPSSSGTCMANQHRLTVKALPVDSKIQIVNFERKYKPGLCLPPAYYDVLVTKLGYVQNRQWIEIKAQDVTTRVVLEKIK